MNYEPVVGLKVFLRYTIYDIRKAATEEIILKPSSVTRLPKDIFQRSLIGATLTKLRVEEKERLVSEERSDEFKVFPETRS